MTRFTILFSCAILSGCKTTPLGWSPSPPPPSHPPTISLFEGTAADPDAIKQTVLRHIPPGTPMDEAQIMLEHQGFTCQCRYGPRPDRIYCHATPHELEEWHLKSFTVNVYLIPDHEYRLRDVEIGLIPTLDTTVRFFQQRPDLHEPLSLPIEAARARMTAAGFRCSNVLPGTPGQDPRSYILCEAFNEWLLGGHIVRVRLYLDESGRVCESKILDKASLFDAERCMWLHGDESTAQAVGKAAAYPLRLSCRYTLLTVAIAMVVTAMPYGLH